MALTKLDGRLDYSEVGVVDGRANVKVERTDCDGWSVIVRDALGRCIAAKCFSSADAVLWYLGY